MQRSIPQANFVNPAFRPTSKFIIGLPLISSTYISLEAPFAINNVFTNDGGNLLRIDTDAFLDELKNSNRINLRANSSLLFLGFNSKKSFISFSINSRLNAGFAFPGSVFETILAGKESNPDGSLNIGLDNLDLKASFFNEVAIGYNRSVTDKLIVGAKLKYLQGIASINIQDLNGSIGSSIDSVYIRTNPWSVQTSGFNYLSDNPDPSYFLFNNKNVGWAIDLGAQYMVTNNIKVTASILDLGGITWKEDTEIREFSSGSYTFDGFDFLEIVQDDGVLDESILDQEIDSIETVFKPELIEGESYKTALTGRFYLGGTYTLMDMHTFGVVFFSEVFKSRLIPAAALTYNIAIGEILDAGISAGYRNKSLGNVGLGLSAKLGPVQVYAVTANLESLLYPARARVVGIHGGLVLALGKISKFE
jgi:hypothetical protein